MRKRTQLATAIRRGKFLGLTKDEQNFIASILDEADELDRLARDDRVSSELIGIRVRNTLAATRSY
jgi:hypothetical protein